MHPKLQQRYQLLEADRNQLESALASMSEELLQKPMAPGKWSALQTLRHLIMAEQSSVAYMKKKLEHAESATPAGLGARLRAGLLTGWFRLGMKAKAPKAFAEIPVSQTATAVFSDYRAVREELQHVLDGIPEALIDRELFKHPLAGRMTLDSALDFFRAHYRHHALQIRSQLGLKG
jgi:uncharacterized damage-inducible protein DinB